MNLFSFFKMRNVAWTILAYCRPTVATIVETVPFASDAMTFFAAFSSMLSFPIFPFNSSQLLKHHFSFVSFRFYPVSLVPFFGTIDPCYRLGSIVPLYRHCVWMFDPLAAPIHSTRNRCASNLRPGISVSRVLCRWILATSQVCLFEKSTCSAIHTLGMGNSVHMISFIASGQDVTVLRKSAICFCDSLQTDGSSLSG